MRTTLTLDDDVAAAIERLLRCVRDERPRDPNSASRSKRKALGMLRLPSIDNISESLPVAEAEDFK